MLAEDGVHSLQQVHTMAGQSVGARKAARRRYDEALKRELVERCAQPGASASALALEHGINANVLFRWRRERVPTEVRGVSRVQRRAAGQAVLLPVSVSPAQEREEGATRGAAQPSAAAVSTGVIEIEVSGARVRVRGGAPGRRRPTIPA